MAHHGRTKRGRKEPVAHREVLGVVPQRGDGIAVIVAHRQMGRALRRGGAERHEPIEQTTVVRRLFVLVVIVVVARPGLRAIQPERRRCVRIVESQLQGEPVDGRRIGPRNKRRLPWRIGGVWIRTEVVVEGVVLVEDHDEVLDRGRRRDPVRVRRHRGGRGEARQQRDRGGDDQEIASRHVCPPVFNASQPTPHADATPSGGGAPRRTVARRGGEWINAVLSFRSFGSLTIPGTPYLVWQLRPDVSGSPSLTRGALVHSVPNGSEGRAERPCHLGCAHVARGLRD